MSKKKADKRRNIVLITTAFTLITAAMVFTLTSVFKPIKEDAAVPKKGSSSVTERILERDGEIRAVWIASVSNINFPSSNTLSSNELKSEIDSILDTVEDNSMNTVVLQVRPSSDALYHSRIFPSSAYLCQKQGQAFPDNIDILKYLTEQAHSRNIAVCAWVNPLRVTTNTTDITTLAESNPARLHPEYTVAYNGALYYDPGIPEVRELIARGVKEIADNYEVDAIVFDDYFYPYPVNDKEFDDTVSYIKYGSSLSLEDWRRQNVNSLIKESYAAIAQKCYFGISPFGIWSNDNGSNGGSKTSGLSAYDSIYCDALSWIEGGYIDFISPQIYWSFTDKNAPFAELCDWWDNKLKGKNIALIISHAAYKVPEWGDAEEIGEQIRYAKKKSSYRGSAIYGYAVLNANSGNICAALKEIY
ncbi:MAG: glycoside hydrolase family 10 protein [Ruminococcaceae bacterium]|nr:glycoside hydrolase family 10 protein [Oscillospiraceae bacterium]